MKTVLMIDDNEDIIELVQLVLANSGYQLTTSRDGLEAVRICLEETPDLVLMDLNMPNLNGFEATKTLREKGFTNPIIVLTASELEEDRQKAEQAGCDGFILKTMEMKGVEEMLDHYLSEPGGLT
ncbi:MAG: response regulator [Gammaproteobacteria bacterium]